MPQSGDQNKGKSKKIRSDNLTYWIHTGLVFFCLTFLIILFTAAGTLYAALRDLPEWKMNTVRTGAPSIIYDKDGKQFATVGFEYYLPVSYDEVPQTVKQAILSTEDMRFYSHRGVDFKAIIRALWANITRQQVVQGGSTITQQIAKNTFLSPSRTIKRKIQEAYLAIQLERHYSKDELFLIYINRIYFGEGTWGIGAAAKMYFNKKVSELNLAEVALLAGLPQAPSYYSPYRNPEKAIERRNEVLDLMYGHGLISMEEVLTAKSEPLKLKNGFKPRTKRTKYTYPFFVDDVIQKVAKKYGEDTLYRGGLKIYTTLDPKLQEAAEKAAADANNFPSSVRDSNGTLQPQTAIVVVEPRTGAIRALVGGREHTASLCYNRATQAYRQPGSAFKPIIAYAPAIEYLGMTPYSKIQDSPINIGGYHPVNYDGRYRGYTNLNTALAYSINIPAVNLLNQVGIDRAIGFARRLGIDTLSPDEGLSLALGGLYKGVTPLQMAVAYASFANGGMYVEPFSITRVTESDGTILEEHNPTYHSVMQPYTAQSMTEMLRSVVSYGTGTRARIYGQDVAGKTGTTDKGRDTWFCGYTADLVGVVWIGWDLPKPMPSAYGGNYCATLWREVISATSSTGRFLKKYNQDPASTPILPIPADTDASPEEPAGTEGPPSEGGTNNQNGPEPREPQVIPPAEGTSASTEPSTPGQDNSQTNSPTGDNQSSQTPVQSQAPQDKTPGEASARTHEVTQQGRLPD